MQAQNFMHVEEVVSELCISESHAYKVLHNLNTELRDKGYLTISGRVIWNFFMEKFCYGKTDCLPVSKITETARVPLWRTK